MSLTVHPFLFLALLMSFTCTHGLMAAFLLVVGIMTGKRCKNTRILRKHSKRAPSPFSALETSAFNQVRTSPSKDT